MDKKKEHIHKSFAPSTVMLGLASLVNPMFVVPTLIWGAAYGVVLVKTNKEDEENRYDQFFSDEE